MRGSIRHRSEGFAGAVDAADDVRRRDAQADRTEALLALVLVRERVEIVLGEALVHDVPAAAEAHPAVAIDDVTLVVLLAVGRAFREHFVGGFDGVTVERLAISVAVAVSGVAVAVSGVAISVSGVAISVSGVTVSIAVSGVSVSVSVAHVTIAVAVAVSGVSVSVSVAVARVTITVSVSGIAVAISVAGVAVAVTRFGLGGIRARVGGGRVASAGHQREGTQGCCE
jgi:hypothetical protein